MDPTYSGIDGGQREGEQAGAGKEADQKQRKRKKRQRLMEKEETKEE